MLEMETLDLKFGQDSKGATTLVVDFAKAFEKVQLSVVWQWAKQIDHPHRVLRVLSGHFAHERG